MLEETIDAPCTQDESGYVDGWMYREVDLSAYAGKTIYVAFRHHGCTGQYLMRLDDIFVYNADGSGIKSMTDGDAAKGIIRQEIFDAQGKQLTGIMPGLNIIRTVYADGSERVAKVMRK